MPRRRTKPAGEVIAESLAAVTPEMAAAAAAQLGFAPPSASPIPPELAADIRAVLVHLAGRRVEAVRLCRPHAKIAPFHASRARRRIIVGGHRSSKSFSTFLESARAFTGQDPFGKYPLTNGRAALVGEDEAHLGRVIFQKMFQPGAFHLVRCGGEWEPYLPDDPRHAGLEVVPGPPVLPERFYNYKRISWHSKKDHQPKYIKLYNGWELFFFSSKAAPPRGVDWDYLLFDEEILGGSWYPEGMARLIDRRGRFVWGAAPQTGTEQFYGLHQEAEAQAFKAAEEPGYEPDIEEWQLSMYDNPYISKKDKDEYDRSLQTDEDRSVRVHGQFIIGTFRVFPEWGRHLFVKPFDIPNSWTRYAYIDPGRTCAVLFFAVPPPDDRRWGKRVVVYDGLYIRQCDARKFGAGMAEKCRGHRFQSFVIDMREARKHETGSGVTIYNQYRRALKENRVRSADTGSGFARGQDDPEGGREAVHRWLQPSPDGEPPTLVVFDPDQVPGLAHLDREMRGYMFARTPGKPMVPTDKPVKRNDHTVDMLRAAAADEPGWVRPRKIKGGGSPAYRDFLKWRNAQRGGRRRVTLGSVE